MNILYVTTVSSTVNAFLIPHIKMLIDIGHNVDVAFNIDHDVKPEIIKMGCKVHQLPLNRFPLQKDNLRAYKMLKRIIISERYDLVHTHTPIASAIVRVSCRNLNNVRVFYTAHGFHFYKGAPILNWLVYYPVEKWLARYTDTLITINKEDYERAKSKFKAKRVDYIPGIGLDIDKFRNVVVDKAVKREEIGVPQNSFVVLSVGELNKNKNHEVVIRAIAKANNSKFHYVICGQGKLDGYLTNLSKKLGIKKQVHLLGFRKDIAEICKVSDLFVFPSIREGLSVALMEAMACGLPIICSDIRGNKDLIDDNRGGYLIDPTDVDEFADKILMLNEEQNRKGNMGLHNVNRIEEYELKNVLKETANLYRG